MTPATPTAPSATSAPAAVLAPQYPSLLGRWRAWGTLTYRRVDTGVTLTQGACSGSMTVNSQENAVFSGSLGIQGGGASSDKFCTAFGTFSGELTPDGGVARAQYVGAGFGGSIYWPTPSSAPACSILSGDGVWTGSATTDRIQVRTTDVVRCPVNVEGGMSTLPMADFERTVTLAFERW